MERPTVLIISEQLEFAHAVTSVWQRERNAPAFQINDPQAGNFHLVIAGTRQVSEDLRRSRAPIIHVSNTRQNLPGVIHIPDFDGWAELVIVVAKQILELKALATELDIITQTKSQLDREASLGRYILEMRHSLNNALTSILGNSELMLMDTEHIPPSARFQLETIRNMGMRMNEILQRLTSLQKEMRLVEEQNAKKLAKSAAAGV